MDARTHHVHHVAKDPQAAAEFYINHFGARLLTPEIEYRGSPYISVTLGEIEVRIRGLRPDEDDAAAKAGRGLHHFGIQVEGLDEFAERLERAGVAFTKKPGEGVLGSRTAFIKAPDDVLIELVEES